MYQIQAIAAMEQQWINVDAIVAAAAGTCFGARSNAMMLCILIRTSYILVPELHTRASKRISKDRLYIYI